MPPVLAELAFLILKTFVNKEKKRMRRSDLVRTVAN